MGKYSILVAAANLKMDAPTLYEYILMDGMPYGDRSVYRKTYRRWY